MLPQEGFQFSKVTDVMTCIVAARNARPYDLHRRDPQPVASLDLGIRIVAHHQHLFRSELVSIQNPRKDALFAFSVGFINRIHVDCRKEPLKPERLNLAFLKPSKARKSPGSARPGVLAACEDRHNRAWAWPLPVEHTQPNLRRACPP